MRLFPMMVVVVAACGVEAQQGVGEVDPATATAAETQNYVVEYDTTTHEVFRDDVASLSAMRQTGLPESLPSYEPLDGADRADAPEGPFRSDIVMGADQRVRVTPTTGYPFRARVRVTMSFSDGYNAVCSGTLVAAKYVLTAGHCLYSVDHGGWSQSTHVYPGQDGSTVPFGSSGASRLRVTVPWFQDQDDDEDFAMITLATPLGNTTGWYGIVHYSDDFLDGNPNVTLGGYPADKPYGTQWQMTGPILHYTDNHYFYNIDTYGGDSGAGVYIIYNGDHCTTGVHHGTGDYWLSEYNMAERITTARYNLIASWINSGI